VVTKQIIPLIKQKTTTMKKGKVKFFNQSKGFGFIAGDDGEEVFVHISATKQDLQENDRVTYDTENGKKGLNAINVSLEK